MKQVIFHSFYNSLCDYLLVEIKNITDDIIRSRVFLADCTVPNEPLKIGYNAESKITILETLLHFPPLSVMGVSLDVVIVEVFYF